MFADIDPETYNLSPDEVDKAITKKTKAIVPVDLYGLSADMKPIREIANKHSLAIVEDAAQAHGTVYKGKSPGAFSDAACWSLYASKNMTTGEGGVVTTNDDKVAEVARMVRTHGERAKYASEMLGYNYRMSEIQAAIGAVQLQKLPVFWLNVAPTLKVSPRFCQKAKDFACPQNLKVASTVGTFTPQGFITVK